MSANGYKIKVNHESENREAQELFFKLGYIWNTGLGTKNLDSKFLYAKNGILTMGFNSDTFDYAENKEITLEELRKLVCRNENGWISGADALIALVDGRKVECWPETDQSIQKRWTEIKSLDEYKLSDFLQDKPRFEFRLKRQTITLNGVEIPAPAEDEDYHHQGIWILNSLEPKEYGYVVLDITDELPRYWWRTEEEIKQVVAALRSAFFHA